MTMSNEAYREDTIKNIPFTELFIEYREKLKYGQALEEAMNESYRDGEISQMFALASELAVVSIKVQILQHEAQRRDEEEALQRLEEVSEVEAALFRELINSLLR